MDSKGRSAALPFFVWIRIRTTISFYEYYCYIYCNVIAYNSIYM